MRAAVEDRSPAEATPAKPPGIDAEIDGHAHPVGAALRTFTGAGHRWTLEEIPDLLLKANAATACEVDALAALPAPLPRARLDWPGP